MKIFNHRIHENVKYFYNSIHGITHRILIETFPDQFNEQKTVVTHFMLIEKKILFKVDLLLVGELFRLNSFTFSFDSEIMSSLGFLTSIKAQEMDYQYPIEFVSDGDCTHLRLTGDYFSRVFKIMGVINQYVETPFSRDILKNLGLIDNQVSIQTLENL